MSRFRDTRLIKRAKPSRTPRAFILIVCEGERTEPAYFAHFKRKLRLANVHIDIRGAECGSDPKSVIGYAAKRFKNDKSIDKCFCVIDRDSHDTNNFKSALVDAETINKLSKSRDFLVHVSDPCIEYWFLLHFEFTRSPFSAKGSKSKADCVIDKLRSVWPEYRKNLTEVGQALDGRNKEACRNSEKALQDANDTGESNPSTSLHLLVEQLENMR